MNYFFWKAIIMEAVILIGILFLLVVLGIATLTIVAKIYKKHETTF